MNSSSKGSISRFVDTSKDPSKIAAEIAKITGRALLSDKQAALVVRLLEKFPADRGGAHDFMDQLFKRHTLWSAFWYTFRFEAAKRVTMMVAAIRNDQRCSMCSRFTTLRAVCLGCRTKDPEAAHAAAFASRNAKSVVTLRSNFGPDGFAAEAIRAKTRATNLKRYGTEHHARNPDVKAKTRSSFVSNNDIKDVVAKRRATSLDRYGVANPMKCKEVAVKTSRGLKKRFSDPVEMARITEQRASTYRKRTGFSSPRQNPEIRVKSAETYRKRTGFDHNMRNPLHVEERGQAHTKKYGVDHPMKRLEVKARVVETNMLRHGGMGKGSAKVRRRIEATNMERYGHEVATSNPLIMAKCKATWFRIYGHESPNKNPEQALKGLRSSSKTHDVEIEGRVFKFQGTYEEILLRKLVAKYGAGRVLTQFDPDFPRDLSWTPDFWVRGKGYFECKSTWTLTGSGHLERNRKKAESSPGVIWVVVHKTARCTRTVVLPADWWATPNVDHVVQQRFHESQGFDAYIKPYVEKIASWVPGSKVKNDMVRIGSTVVVFVPLYWPSTSSSMLKRKQKAEERGLRMVFVHEHYLRLRTVATRNYVQNLAGLNNKTVFGRKCVVVKHKITDVKAFLNTYHIQGAPLTGNAYCLYHEDKMVGVMVFNHTTSNRGSRKTAGIHELTRFATSLHIPGGASKLLAAFKRECNPESIVSYSDNTIFDGQMYTALGFTKTRVTHGDYMAWAGGLDVRSKQFYSLKSLAANWPKFFNPSLTEKQNCEFIGLRTINTLGKTRWELKEP